MKVLVAGGTGLVGKVLIEKLVAQNHEVINLTTRKESHGKTIGNAKQIYWNPTDSFVQDITSIECDAVLNLAGFSIAKRWTKKNKELLLSSRIDSTNTLVQLIKTQTITPRIYVQASASGYYPSSAKVVKENSPVGNDFLANLVQQWEVSSSALNETNVRRVILRFGMVLGKDGGALKQLIPLFKMGFGSALGNGKQLVSWIHVGDLADMIIHSITNENVNGVYNASSPNVVTNKELSKSLAKALKKPFFLPNVPAFVLKMVLGEMSSILLVSQNLSAEKVLATGFKFQHEKLDDAFNDLLN